MRMKQLKKNGKRSLALFLVIVMCLSIFPFSAFAEGDSMDLTMSETFESEDNGSDVIENSVDGNDGEQASVPDGDSTEDAVDDNTGSNIEENGGESSEDAIGNDGDISDGEDADKVDGTNDTDNPLTGDLNVADESKTDGASAEDNDADFSNVDEIVAEYLGLREQLPSEITKENMAEVKPILKRYDEIQSYIDTHPDSALADEFYDGQYWYALLNAGIELDSAKKTYEDLVQLYGEPEDPDTVPTITAVDEGITVALEDGTFTISGSGTFTGKLCVNGIETTVKEYMKLVEITAIEAENVTLSSELFEDVGCLQSLTATNVIFDREAFQGAFAEGAEITLEGCKNDESSSYVFAKNNGISVTMDSCAFKYAQFAGSKLTSLAVESMELGSSLFADCSFASDSDGAVEVDLSTVTAVRKGAFDNAGGFWLTNIPADMILEHSHSFNVETVDGYNEIILALLADDFEMLEPKTVENIAPNGWTSARSGEKNAVTVPGTQITEEARWSDTAATTADVLFKAYCTENQQMDFVFVMDCSNSMGDKGDDNSLNARFYSMQSKIADVAGELLSSAEYDCRVAFVGFGGDSYNLPTWEDPIQYTEGSSFRTDFFENAVEAKDYILGRTVFDEYTNYDIGLSEALELVKANKADGRGTTVIFITDGQPTMCDKEYKNPYTGEIVHVEDTHPPKTYEKACGVDEANAIKADGAQIIGVLQSVPSGELGKAEDVMERICTAGKYFSGEDAEGFSKAVNDAVYRGLQSYTMSWQIHPSFTLDESQINCSEGTSVEITKNEDGTFVSWTLSGQTYERQTLQYQLNLRSDLISVVGTRDYDVNEGDAVLTSGGGEAVNTVTTPTLSRTVSSSSGGSSDPTPGTDNDSDPAVEIPDGNVPLTETPEVIVPDTDVPLVDVPGLEEESIPEEQVPLGDAPATGDVAQVQLFLAMALGSGLVCLALNKKRRKEHAE